MPYSFDHIDRYIRGELTPRETSEFEEELRSDPELKERVEEQREILNGLRMGFNRELKDMLENEERRITKKPEMKRLWLFPTIGIAAVVTLLIVGYFALIDSIDTNDLYSKYYAAYPNVESPVARSEEADNNPFNAYEQGNYRMALSIFQELLTAEPENDALLFYSGICYLELNQPSEALSQFEETIMLSSPEFSRPAIWYSSLAHLKEGNISRSSALLNSLLDNQDLYSRKASELLDDIH